MSYFSGQGRVFIGSRDINGNPQGLTFVGNVPDLKVSLSVETLEHQESQSGQRLTDLQLIKTKKGEFACTLEELIQTNLELSLYGSTTTVTSGTVTDDVVDDSFDLVEDDAPPPAPDAPGVPDADPAAPDAVPGFDPARDCPASYAPEVLGGSRYRYFPADLAVRGM